VRLHQPDCVSVIGFIGNNQRPVFTAFPVDAALQSDFVIDDSNAVTLHQPGSLARPEFTVHLSAAIGVIVRTDVDESSVQGWSTGLGDDRLNCVR